MLVGVFTVVLLALLVGLSISRDPTLLVVGAAGVGVVFFVLALFLLSASLRLSDAIDESLAPNSTSCIATCSSGRSTQPRKTDLVSAVSSMRRTET